MRVLSDHREASFGTSYGVLIKELRLLVRSIFIIDKNDRIAYIQIVPEITRCPDYDKSLMVDKTLEEVEPDGYDMLILSGGRAPEALKKEKKVVEIIKEFFQKSKPISAICHGPQLLAAEVLEGKRVTSYQSVAGEMRDAGAMYEDKEVIVDENLVASRQPSDLPFFLRETMKILKGK